MGHTNTTQNLNLPQFVSTDKPTWLGDINGAFQSIDAGYGNAIATATGAETAAQNATTAAAGAVETANAASASATSAATDAATAIGTANTAADTANNAQSTAVLAKNTADGAAADAAEAKAASIRGGVSVIADGVKTFAQLFADLITAADITKIGATSILKIGASFAQVAAVDTANGNFHFSRTLYASTSSAMITTFRLSNDSAWCRVIDVYIASTITTADNSNTVVTAGDEIALLY